jgi:hypothetical protein
MNYIYSQLFNLIKEEYTTEDILWELQPDREDLKSYLFNAEFSPNEIFDKDELEEWLKNNGWVKE